MIIGGDHWPVVIIGGGSWLVTRSGGFVFWWRERAGAWGGLVFLFWRILVVRWGHWWSCFVASIDRALCGGR